MWNREKERRERENVYSYVMIVQKFLFFFMAGGRTAMAHDRCSCDADMYQEIGGYANAAASVWRDLSLPESQKNLQLPLQRETLTILFSNEQYFNPEIPRKPRGSGKENHQPHLSVEAQCCNLLKYFEGTIQGDTYFTFQSHPHLHRLEYDLC